MIYHHYMTNTNANKLIPAATVLIVRNGQSGLEVFMVVRNHQIDFASGALVFPGGKLDKSDYDKRLVQFLSNSNVNDKDDLPYRVAAIRESFEEANVLFLYICIVSCPFPATRITPFGLELIIAVVIAFSLKGMF